MYLFFLSTILLIICFFNYTPGTWLIGWDNIMPEFDIWLNLKRSLFAVWQEYQGLGLVAGMAHSTDLVREIILLPFTLILPHSIIRYLWHFSLLFLGTFGVFFGLTKKFPKHISFLASLFYLLNFGSIQYFWAPLESFSAFWGFFPWLIFTLFLVLEHPTKKNYFKLIIINFLAIPAFYVQTIFIVYIICVFIILLSHFFFHLTDYRLQITNCTKIILSILAINSFWLLPIIYFFVTNLHNPTLGIGNFMSSDESFARNERRGYFSDFALLRGYYFDFPDSNKNFMQPWIDHFNYGLPLVAGYLIFFIIFLGLVSVLSKPKKLSPFSTSILLLLLLSSIALLSSTPPFQQINQLIRQNPLLNQIFRAPFTKFIVPAIFTFTILTAYGLQLLTHFATKLKYSSATFSILLITVYCLLFAVFSFPAFTGNYISPNLRQKIPSDYFELFSYFKTKPPTARIANLPTGSFWGWTNYHWGAEGSGFIWYGLTQPILDRAFDAWNLSNEQYYWELSHAIQSRNLILLENIFQKYSIEYVLFDNSVIFPDDQIYSKNSTPTKELLSQIPNLVFDKQFGQISIYRYSQPSSPYLLTNVSDVDNPHYYYYDQAFLDFKDYVTTSKPKINYTFQNIFSNRLQSEFKFSISNFNISDVNSIDSNINLTTLNNTTNQKLLATSFPTTKLSQSYLLKIEYQYLSGLPLTISVNSNNRFHKYLDTRLETKKGWQTAWFIIPQQEIYDVDPGITVLLANTSLNLKPTINQVKSIKLYPIPLSQLVKTNNSHSLIKPTSTKQFLSSTSDIFIHKISVPATSASTLVLPQAFSSGWVAFYFQKNRINFLNDHFTANGWANAWQLPSFIGSRSLDIYILFWPQLLEFIGFGLLAIVFIWTLRKR